MEIRTEAVATETKMEIRTAAEAVEKPRSTFATTLETSSSSSQSPSAPLISTLQSTEMLSLENLLLVSKACAWVRSVNFSLAT